MELCKRVRFGGSSIFLSRGEVKRKEGEPKRRKLFVRKPGGPGGIIFCRSINKAYLLLFLASSKLSGNETTPAPEATKNKKKKKPKPQNREGRFLISGFF